MTEIQFRFLPGVSNVEQQLEMQSAAGCWTTSWRSCRISLTTPRLGYCHCLALGGWRFRNAARAKHALPGKPRLKLMQLWVESCH